MDADDIRILAAEIGPMMRNFVSASLTPIATRLASVEKRFSELPIPTNGKDADLEAISNVVMLRLKPEVEGLSKIITQEIPGEVAKAVEKLPTPKDGNSVSVEDVAPLILAEVAKRFEAMPVPKDGASPTAADIEPVVQGAIAPDDVAMNVAKAIRFMAETPEIVERETAGSFGGGVNIHLPNVVVPDVVIPEIKLPEIKMPPVHVNVEQPKKRRTRTVVTEHDTRGRVKKFEQEEID